ncbi:MAG: replicative DNA helicase [Selenomonadaceae bacterium]|nr:replicative DNA helicase [Selenomonadaceae bacterium]
MNFLELKLKSEYRSFRDNIIEDFYNPVLERAVIYKRAVGFFSSNILAYLVEGILKLIENGGSIQMITSPKLSVEDMRAINDGFERRDKTIKDLPVREKMFQGNFENRQLNFLSNLIAIGRLDFKIAVLETDNDLGMFHEKFGLMCDAAGNVIAFSGSMNETANAFKSNYEAIDVFTSWTHDAERVKTKEATFDSLWNNRESGVKVLDCTFENSLLSEQVDEYDAEKISTVMSESFERINFILDNPGKMLGIPSGFLDLDKVLNGFKKSDLIILAARPSMGKTALALNIATNAASAHSVMIFSLEMSKLQLGIRLLSSASRVNSHYLNTGNINNDDLIKVINDLIELSNLKIYINDKSNLSLMELQKKAHRLKRKYGLDLMVIDYMQLIQASKEYRGNRVQEMSEISRGLKTLARELNVPILALSQLSRNVEMRLEKKPQLSDLRESGSIEQDADIVMFLYRDEYYNPDDTNNANIAELIIAKNRNGPTKSIRLRFDKEITRFDNLALD